VTAFTVGSDGLELDDLISQLVGGHCSNAPSSVTMEAASTSRPEIRLVTNGRKRERVRVRHKSQR
jgi:hypothetical protein